MSVLQAEVHSPWAAC